MIEKPLKKIPDSIYWLLIFCISLLLYIFTMPVTVVLEDDGFFSIGALYNGLVHPPGYPLFVMLAHVFTWIPFGSIAWRVHLASAFFGAVACVLLWQLVYDLLKDRRYALFAGLGLAVSSSYWSQAIIAEVYTLNVLLLLLLLLLAHRCTLAGRSTNNTCVALAFCYGLALSNHWPMVVLSTPALLAMVWPVRQGLLSNLHRYAGIAFLGLLPYAWLVWRSHVVPEISFFGPIDTLRDFWFYVSREGYAAFDYSLTAGWSDKLFFTGFIISETARQFAYLGIVFVLAGIGSQVLHREWRLLLAMVLAYLGCTLFIVLLRSVDYEPFQQAIFQVYPLISYAVCWIWAAMGLKWIISIIPCAVLKPEASGMVTLMIAAPLLALLLINYPVNDRHDDWFADEYGRLMLDSLPRDAIFYSNADNIDGPVTYLNKVEGYRSDVSVYTGRFLLVDDELQRPYEYQPAALRSLINRFIHGTERPVFYSNDFPHDFGSTGYGFYRAVNRQLAAGQEDLMVLPMYANFLLAWSDRYKQENPWNRMHFNLLMADMCRLLLDAVGRETVRVENNDVLESMSRFSCRGYQGTLYRIGVLLNSAAPDHDMLRLLFVQAETLSDQAYTRREQARFYYLRGIYNMQLVENQQARVNLQQSMQIWPHPDNPARQLLIKLQDGS